MAAWSGTVHLLLAENAQFPAMILAELQQDKVTLAKAELAVLHEERVLIPQGGGEAVALGGRLRIKAPGDALGEDTYFLVRDVGPDQGLPNSLSGRPFEVTALGVDSARGISAFNGTITLEIFYQEGEAAGDEAGLTLFWFDPSLETWRPLPTVVDQDRNVLQGITDHLSVFDFTVQNWEAARLPSISAFQVAPFTGAATYSMPIELPSGPGGLQPTLSLTYNSQAVDAAGSRTQSSWVGMGWSLETGSIRRNMNGTIEYEDDDTYTLQVNGVASLLIPVPDADGDPNTINFKTADDNFYRIREYVSTGPMGYLGETSYWLVWDNVGNQYRFDPGAYYPDYNSCWIQMLRRWEWPLSRVTNSFGQSITYAYDTEVKVTNKCDSHPTEQADQSYHTIAAYPLSITYPHNRYRVRFLRTSRSDIDPAWEDINSRVLFQRTLLSEVVVDHDSDGNGSFEQVVRRYVFT